MSHNKIKFSSKLENNGSAVNNLDSNAEKSPIISNHEVHSFALQQQILNDRIFIRDKHKKVKIFLKDILYLEASRNYCKLVSCDSQFLISGSMKAIEEKINSIQFLKVHRSFVINIEKIDAILYDNHVLIGNKEIPISKQYYDVLIKIIRLV